MIEQLTSPRGDNYSYVLHDGHHDTAMLVDPVNVDPVQQFLDEEGLEPRFVVNTHGHGDHTGGNSAFREQGAELIAHRLEENRVGDVDQIVLDGETLEVGNLDVQVIHTPGHTAGSICLRTDDGLISGDTVFLAGCGNPKYGGDTRDLFETFRDKIRPLDDSLNLYPGHDYALRNLEFAQDCEPRNTHIEEKLEEIRERRQSDQPPRSTLGEEKSYNPFLRYDQDSLRNNLSNIQYRDSDWDVFKELRDLRNRW